jgi:23S rRNA (uridine2552-2'-O)-methyltransferase
VSRGGAAPVSSGSTGTPLAPRDGPLLSSAVPAYDRKDAAYRRAKQEGYRSRAAYKLLDLDAHFRVFRAGQRVVDVGCWPGAWMQVASRRVGASGRVVGIDVVPTDPLDGNAVALVGDVCDPAARQSVAVALGGPADVVLCDVAPKLSGIVSADAARHAALVEAALAGTLEWLGAQGGLLVKLFMDAEQPRLVAELRAAFASVRTRRPESTRRGSAEIYAWAQRLR